MPVSTLGDLLGNLLPAARPLGPLDDAALARAIAWVRIVRARVPALDVLEPGDVVLVPAGALAVVAPTADDADTLVEALATGGAAAIVVIGADAASDEPPPEVAALAELAAAADLPVVAVADADPVALEREVVAYLVNRQLALELRAEELERRLEALALRSSDLAALVAAIAGFFGRAVVLEGRRGDPLAVHAPGHPTSAAAAARRYLADREGIALRVPLPVAPAHDGDRSRPVRAGDAPVRGSLILLGEVSATEGERLACERVAALLALELGRDVAVQRAREAARRSESLPPDGPPWVVIVARQAARARSAGVPAGTTTAGAPAGATTAGASTGAVVEAADRDDDDHRQAMRAEIRLLAPNRRLILRGDVESLEYRLVAVADERDPHGLVIAERVASLLRRIVVVSRPFGEPGGRSSAEAEARATLEAAEIGGMTPGVVRADRLPAYRILGDLHNLPDGARLARALLEPVLAGRPSVVAARLWTLRAVLDHPGPAEAAQALGVHRNTIGYRVRRIEALGGWDLRDPELRLALSIALRIVQTAQ